MEEQTFKAALCRSLSVTAPHTLLSGQMSVFGEKSFQLPLDVIDLPYSNTVMGCKKEEQLSNTIFFFMTAVVGKGYHNLHGWLLVLRTFKRQWLQSIPSHRKTRKSIQNICSHAQWHSTCITEF